MWAAAAAATTVEVAFQAAVAMVAVAAEVVGWVGEGEAMVMETGVVVVVARRADAVAMVATVVVMQQPPASA